MKISNKTMKRVQEEQKCIGCNACMKGCPMLNKFCDSPKDLLKSLQEEKTFNYKLPYSCMLCGYCTKVCPKEVDLKQLFLELRKDTVDQNEGKLPKELNISAVELHQKFSFSDLFTSDIKNLQSDTIFFPGCALLSYSTEIVENTYKYLREKIPGIGIYNKCCGKPTNFIGKEKQFKEYFSILENEFKAKNVKRVITGCQNCFMTISDTTETVEVISLWETLSYFGIPESKKGIGKNLDQKFTIHDPCPTRNVNVIHESIRDIISQLELKSQEMKNNRGNTLCCGSGGMVFVTQADIAKAHAERRATESNTDHIITYCQECVESMRKGGKNSFHILDVLFNEEFENMNQKNNSTIKKWINRYKSKNIKVNSSSKVRK